LRILQRVWRRLVKIALMPDEVMGRGRIVPKVTAASGTQAHAVAYPAASRGDGSAKLRR